MIYKIEFKKFYDINRFYLYVDSQWPLEALSYCIGNKKCNLFNYTTCKGKLYNFYFCDTIDEYLFQQSLVWDNLFPFWAFSEILKVSYENNYNFDIIKNILVQKGVIK